ncbi:PK beta-barrel-protein domain-containing protein-like protein [Periconia macrospinosa]|uniref:PK beta-barrel-protein domain-containing protein-like protein n=1 Tax=Periconia macrospinosa TaxID=97972 RepID=A0A2V1DKZ8_9PLEO|nr:PK beta-barrel-protein domain-containing protein-like protein [Periconia macrospinosa]
MATSSWTPPAPPDPSTLCNPPPFDPFPLIHLRSGKVKPAFKPGMESGIYKTAHTEPVKIDKNGIVGDEHAYEPHRHPDKAIHHYCSAHYAEWASEIPESAHLFKGGAFGENLFNSEVSEKTLCIGDKIALGDEVVLELTEPRSPCYKLNHRFEVKNMAVRVQTLLRCGWLYRVLVPGTVQPGAMIRLLERPCPEWTVARVMYYLFIERENLAINQQIVLLPALGEEIRQKFQKRIEKGKGENELDRQFGGEVEKMDSWNPYRIVSKHRETKTVVALTLESVDPIAPKDTRAVDPGSHIRVKLGGKLVRAYSIVSGTNARFTLGVALDPESRGGSHYLHHDTQVGDVLTVSRITCSFPLIPTAEKHILIAGGIGITAFLAAINHVDATKQSSYDLHFAVADEVPFLDDLLLLQQRQRQREGNHIHIYRKSHSQRLSLPSILSRAQDTTTHIYVCGPTRLMDAVVSTAAQYSIPEDSVHLEAFTVATSGDPFTAVLKVSGGNEVEVGAHESLLDALRRVGMDVASSCEVGNCGTCRVEVCEGRVVHRGTGLEGLEGGGEGGGGGLLACVSRGVGRIVLDL